MTGRTIDQLLRVIELTRDRVRQGYPLDDSYHRAVHLVAKEYGVRYQTIGDGCRRRLGLEDIDEFKQMMREAFAGRGDRLRNLILRNAPEGHRPKVNAVFQEESHRNTIQVPVVADGPKELSHVSYTVLLTQSDAKILKALSQLEDQTEEDLIASLGMEGVRQKMKSALQALL